jgi:sugar diacid utilization regulator
MELGCLFMQQCDNARAASMQKKNLITQGNALSYLESAALYPQRRGEMIGRALQDLLTSLPAVGTALIWPCQERKIPWKIYYAGLRRESMQPWLRARLDVSLDATLGVLQHDLSKLSEMPFPQFMCLQPASISAGGLWIIWPQSFPRSDSANNLEEEVRLGLEALLEVESAEERFFSSTSPLFDQALIEELAQSDSHALSALLGLTRLVGNADLTFWGRAYGGGDRKVVKTNDHMGAKHSEFGFEVPYGEGMGGRVAAFGRLVSIEDYHNSPYRYPDVVDAVDREQLRSGIALPVRSRIGQEKSGSVAGILYVTRRTVKPFTLAERLLVQRMTQLLEPLRPLTLPIVSVPLVSEQKANWHKLILYADRIESLESWIGQFVKGATIIVTDSEGHPYVSAHREQLEHLQAAFEHTEEGVQVLSLSAPGVSSPGQIYLRSSVVLPPHDWPDFFADLVVGCNLIIGRMEQARDYLAREREQWLHALLQGKLLPHVRQDGRRLGLPVGEGQLWVIAWPSQRLLTRQAVRQRTLAEDIVLNQLESQLLFLGDDIGVILLDKHIEQNPSKLRDALLTHQFAPDPLWIVYGARYHSLRDLKMLLTQNISQAQKARREGKSEYLINVQTTGLESLLANPRLTEELHSFATKLLAPLLEHDKGKTVELTTTFVLTQMLGSVQAVAEELDVHVNTVRYRLHKAEEILGIEKASPKERITWGFASFIWLSFHPLE